MINALFVHALSGFQDFKVHSDFGGQVNEGLYVFRKTKTAVAESGLEKLSANTSVETHSMCDFLDVRADLFAQIRDDIGITDFQRQKGIRSVLNQLGAVDGGDQEFRLVSQRTGSIVHGASKSLFQNGPVDLLQYCR